MIENETLNNFITEEDFSQSGAESTLIPIKIANEIVQSYIDNLNETDLYEAEASLDDISSLVHRVINQKNNVGDASDWHNFAVDVARKNLYDLACDLLECALDIYPKNIDLLADYLQNGISCGRIDKCKAYYKTLSAIPKIRWTWRGYSFTINYLMYLWDRCDSEKELEKIKNEMLNLADEFKNNLPYDEECYRCKADICKLLHDKKAEEESLREALENVKIAPKCALRLSDLLFERGDYEESLSYIQRGLRDAMQTQRSINDGYLYYLRGLSKMALAQQSDEPFTDTLAEDIYSDFDISLHQEKRPAYLNTMRAKTLILLNKSGHQIPEAFEELNYLIQ